MDKALHDTVLGIAEDVRFWAEGKAEHGLENLKGWCAKASAELFRLLCKEGIESEIHLWVHKSYKKPRAAHVFLVVDDHVVDVTATQFEEFSNTPVLIMHHREAEVYEFYQTVKTFKSIPELIAGQKKTRWPTHQIAFK